MSPEADDAREVSARMGEAARELEARPDLEATSLAAVELAVRNVEGCDVAGLSWSGGGRVETLAASSPDAQRADELQYEHGEGPCLDAIRRETTVYCPSLAYDRRWQRWGLAVVEEVGLNSVLAFQLYTSRDTVGALNLYARDKQGFSSEDRLDGTVLAAHIAIAVVAAQQEEQFETALASRTVIGQATGRIMERYGLTPDRAFAVLARVASSSERKIRDVAQGIVATGRMPPEAGRTDPG